MEKPRVIRFGSFEANLHAHELRKRGMKLKLQEQPFRVLAMLLERPGELVTREEIRESLWPGDTFVDFDHSLNAAVRRLREALNDSAERPRFVETLPRRGYRFVAPVAAGNHSGDIAVAGAAERDGHPTRARPRWRRFWLMVAGLAGVAAILLAFNVGSLRNRIFQKPSAHIHSIAVLPLVSLSHDKGHAYFAAGMTDELITELSKIGSLRVIARTSSMAYQGSKKPLREIARELNVDAIVEGTVEQAGGRVRINVQLADGLTACTLWAQSYERDSKDVLSLQSDVAEAIAKKIQAEVTPQERRRLRAARPVNPAAHDAYLRGRYLIDQRNSSEARRSTQYFLQAIRLDLDYAAAYAGLSMSLISQTFFGIERPRDVMPKARAAARHALQLDPDSGEAYTALGTIEFCYDYDWKAAGKDLQRGIQLDPNDPLSEILYTFYLASTGKLQQAVADARRAVKLDPVSFFANRTLAAMLYYDRRYDAALAQLQRTRELNHDSGVVENWACWAYEKKHMDDQAVRADLRDCTENGVPAADVDFFRKAYAHAGWRAYWEARIRRLLPLAKEHPVSYGLGIAYARIGDRDDAFRRLNRAVDRHSIWAITLAVDPKLDSLRSDPRFQALLHRIHLPQQTAQAMR
jgi:TolB-like protein/DNA-binding winged helix-turn-helix (wHTH) protein/Tfp pilus assembly protein PilF